MATIAGKGSMAEPERRQPSSLDAVRPSSLTPGSAGSAGQLDPRRQGPGGLGPGPTPSPAHQSTAFSIAIITIS